MSNNSTPELVITALMNGMSAEWRTPTSVSGLDLIQQEGKPDAWRLLGWFECSTMPNDDKEITYNNQNLHAEAAIRLFARFCETYPEETNDE